MTNEFFTSKSIKKSNEPIPFAAFETSGTIFPSVSADKPMHIDYIKTDKF